jgi:predicted AAA+ superfamily ATPase
MLIGNSGSGRKSIVKLSMSIWNKAKLELLNSTNDSLKLLKELTSVIVKSIRSKVVLLIEEHSQLSSEKLHWV